MKRIASYTLSSLCVLLFLALTTIAGSVNATDKHSTEAELPEWCAPQWASIDTLAYAFYFAIEAISRDNAWAVGDTGLGRVRGLAHWDGHTWTPYPLEFPPPTLATNYSGLSAWSEDDVWLVGSYPAQNGTGSYAIHWDGLGWSTVASNTASTPLTVTGVLNSVEAVGPGEAYAIGTSADTLGPVAIVHCTLSGCADMPHDNVYRTLTDISAANANDAWAVGATGSNNSLFMHYYGKQWSTVTTPNIGRVYSVESLAPNDAWAAGEGGTLHWDGTAWSQADAPPSLRRLSGTAPNDLWAAGEHIWHWDGSTWTVSKEEFVISISASAPDNVWAGRYDPNSDLLWYTPVCYADVTAGSTFFSYAQDLTDRAIISGYPCGGPGEPCDPSNRPYYRPQNNVTRGQLSRIIVLAAGLPIPTNTQTFEDVPVGSTFHPFIEALYNAGAINGYPCGGSGEPCIVPDNRPYFRPSATSTRGQTSKIVAITAGYTDPFQSQTFEDVPTNSTFYLWIENLASRSIINGYPCGSAGEPCVAPTNRPYFRTANNVTRGQMSKIAVITFTP